MSPAARLYRASLRLLPRRFREEAGEEMLACFEALCEDAIERRGRLAVTGLLLRGLADVMRTAAAERRDRGDRGRGKVSFAGWGQSLRWALRASAARPASTAFVVATLALGIGANVAGFAVVYESLVRPLPFADPDRLVVLFESDRESGEERGSVAPGNFHDWSREATSFERMAAFVRSSVNLTGEGDPERLVAYRISSGFFPALGVGAHPGSSLVPAVEADEATPWVLLGNELWRRRFGGDPGVVGRTVRLDDQAHLVIGVMPERLGFPRRDAQVFLPLRFDGEERFNRRSHYLEVVARLRPGRSIAQARDEMRALTSRLAAEHPDTNEDVSASVFPLRDELIGPSRARLLLLAAAAGAVLLLACVNVSSLVLASVSRRMREVRLRIALGASRLRLAQQIVVEALVVSMLGGTLGLGLHVVLVDVFEAFTPAHVVLPQSGLSTPVLLATLVLSIGVGLTFAALPALELARTAARASLALHAPAGPSPGVRGVSLRRGLIAAEVALAVCLLVGAGLLLRSFQRLADEQPGFRAENVLTMRIELSGARYASHEQKVTFYREVLARVGRHPDVVSAGFVTFLPLTFQGGSTVFELVGDAAKVQEEPVAVFRSITPDYFRAMGIPLLQGRGFSDEDDARAPRIVVVNEALARAHAPRGDAAALVGKRLRIWGDEHEVVGIVADVREQRLGGTAVPSFYVSVWQRSFGWFDPRDLAVRTRGGPPSLAAALRAEIRAIDPEQTVASLRTMGDVVGGSVATERTTTLAVSFFALVATLLAAVGIFGVVSGIVAERTAEIGLRMALGARRANVLRWIVGGGMGPALGGLGLGLAGALAGARLLTHLLYEIRPADPWTYGATAALATAVMLGACLVPALRASRVDPLVALRSE